MTDGTIQSLTDDRENSRSWSSTFLSATEYHSDVDYNSRRMGVVVVVIVFVVHTFKNGLIFERPDRFASYLEEGCTWVSRSAAYANVKIGPSQPAQT